ncbi:MAG: hypothetical protein LN561_06750 [Rickettsia endosymbiont of Labidopullus appendiculatus]|nr:hypothetical protein [Rickettsia endosymbiont of Labidopullus appendiculatus]
MTLYLIRCLDRIIGSQYKGAEGFSLDYVMGQGWKKHDTLNSNQPPQSLYDLIYDEAGSTNASILLKKPEDPRVKFHTPYNQYINNKKTVNNTKLGDKPPTQPKNPPAAPNIPQGSWDYTLAMLGISPTGDASVTPKTLPSGGDIPKSVVFKSSNKPTAELTEFKWTEEGITKLLAANPANKITPPIPPLDIMVRDQSLPTTSNISVEESNRELDPIKNLSDDELRTAFGSVTSGIKYILSGPDEHGARIIEEHRKRFPEAEGQKNIEALGLRLSSDPVSAIIKVGVEKVTGTKLPGEIDPTDFIPKRVGLPTVSGGNKVEKDTAPKPKIIEGKAIDINNPEVPGTSGLSKEPHLPTHTSDITAKAKTVEKTSMLANKVEQKLPTSEVGEVKLGTSNVAGDLSLKKQIENVTGITKPVDPKLEQYTKSLKQYENWPQLSKLVEKVPGEFGVTNYNKKMDGLRWKKGGDSIRIDRGDPSAKYVTQQVDHVAISYNGKVVDNTGKNYIFKDKITGGVYKMDRTAFDAGKRNAEHGFDLNMQIKEPAKHPDAHIPADQWAKWKSFHKPD